MLAADAVQVAALRSHQTGGIIAVARYRGEQTSVQVEQSGSVNFRGAAEIQATSRVTAFGTDSSLVPKEKSDFLATYGQELALWRTVRVSDTTWTIPLGVYRITRAGDSVERYRAGTVVEWAVDISLADRFEQIRADDFLAVDSPVPGNTVWAEIQRLSPIPVIAALDDATVPPATVYESRLGAITTLMQILGGVPHLTREGALTARMADSWLTSVTPLFDIPGTITWSDEMVNDFYNQVQTSNPNDKSIVAYSQITEPWDPLAVQNAGGRTYKHSSPIYSNIEEAQAGADTIKQRVSLRRSRTVRVSCTPEALLLELGDFGWMRDPVQNRAVLGEVAAITVPLDPTHPVDVEMIVSVQARIVEGEIVAADPITYPSAGVFPSEELFPGGMA